VLELPEPDPKPTGGLTDYRAYITDLLSRQEQLIREVGSKEQKQATEPPIIYKGTEISPVEVTDEPGVGGSRIIRMKRCVRTEYEKDGKTHVAPVCKETTVLLDAKTLKCMQELPEELLKRHKDTGRSPTAREKIRAALICNDSMNAKLLSIVTGIHEDHVHNALTELRQEGVIESPPPKEISVEVSLEPVEPTEFEQEPEQRRKVTEKIVHTGLDPVGLRLYQVKLEERDKVKSEICGKPCLRDQWWRQKT
jgi:hypothetical protein